jgi:subtilisin family serine protease
VSGVDRVLQSPRMRPLADLPRIREGDLAAPTEPEWNLTIIGAPRVWREFDVRGNGVTIGQSDSGVQWDHPELLDSYRGAVGDHDFNWLDPWWGEPLPYDVSGHGTHTLGSVLGNRVGVAPDAEWFACANLVRNLGNPALYLDCLQFMLAPYPIGGEPLQDGDPALAADVLNNSWGCPSVEGCDAESLQMAADALRAAGIFVVVSAGNDGEGGCKTVADPLAIYDEVFSVGAVDRDGAVADFSSRGPVTVDGSGRIKPDIIAPGVDVLSATPNSTYALYPGTSMAGPHLAGAVALRWSANPALIGKIERTADILRKTVTPYDFRKHGVPECGDATITPDNAVGYGILNAYAAVEAAIRE